LRKVVIEYYLDEYFGIDVQMEVIDLILFLLFDSPMLSPIFYYTILNLKKNSSKFNYKQNINLFWKRFVGIGLKCDTLDVVIF
jgi:hypothetical protein